MNVWSYRLSMLGTVELCGPFLSMDSRFEIVWQLSWKLLIVDMFPKPLFRRISSASCELPVDPCLVAIPRRIFTSSDEARTSLFADFGGRLWTASLSLFCCGDVTGTPTGIFDRLRLAIVSVTFFSCIFFLFKAVIRFGSFRCYEITESTRASTSTEPGRETYFSQAIKWSS